MPSRSRRRGHTEPMFRSRRRFRIRSACSALSSHREICRAPQPNASNRKPEGTMNTTNRFWHVAAAAGLALLAVLLTTFYVTNYKRHVQHGEAQVTVLIASKDIPADTAGAEIVSGKWLTQETVARRQVVPGAISDPAQVRGLVATQPTYAGEQ